MNFNGKAVVELRRRGVDFVTAQEDGQGETTDPELLDRATELRRVLCTLDDDFLTDAPTDRTPGGTLRACSTPDNKGFRSGTS